MDKVFSKTISYTARALWDATLSVTRYVGESTRDILNKTSVKTSAEPKFTEEIGMEFNFKGEGGGGASMTFSESSITVENSLSLDKGSEASFETSKNNDVKYKGVGQIGGNGAEFSYTQSEDGTVSSEGKVTTSTSVPLVQTETSVKVDNKGGLEIAYGVAAGVKTPIMLTPKFTTIHVSIDLGIKLIYDKNED